MRGTRLQDAFAKTFSGGRSARGLHVRGVVVQTYLVDERQAVPAPADGASPFDSDAHAVYCDVVVYSGLALAKRGVLRRVVVAQDRGTIHDGSPWVPRPSRINVQGAAYDNLLHSVNPGDLDGEHVLITYLDDDLFLPVIVKGMPHPSTDRGKDVLTPLSQRLLTRTTDLVDQGVPRFVKHNGTVAGIDGLGNVLIDTRRAYDGVLEQDGSEPEPDPDNIASPLGNVHLILPKGAQLTLTAEGLGDEAASLMFDNGGLSVTTRAGLTFSISYDADAAEDVVMVSRTDEDGELLIARGNGPTAKLQLGNGLMHVPIVEKLEAFYGQLKDRLDALDAALATHVHPTGTPTTGAPVAAPAVSAPAWDPAINSTMVSIPDNET